MSLLFSNWRPAQRVKESFLEECVNSERTSRHDEDKRRGWMKMGRGILVARVVQVLVDCAVPEQPDSFFRVTRLTRE